MKDNDYTAQNPFRAPLMNDQNVYPRGPYEPYPSFDLGKDAIGKGYEKLAEHIINEIPKGLRVLVIDGFPGTEWKPVILKLTDRLLSENIEPELIPFENCLKRQDELNSALEPFLGGDDRIFGTHYPFGPEVFFDTKKVADLRIEAAIRRGNKAGRLTIVFGCGSSLIELWDELWYMDMPKDCAQELFRCGRANNLGYTTANFEEYYKRSYFIEWPAFSRLKKRVLNDISIFIDAQNENNPTFASGAKFRTGLTQLSSSPFRVRPWFYPGPWGGQFMKGHMGLDKSRPNYAWSFELIVPENGLTFSSGDNQLECSFDFLMFMNNTNVLGHNAARQFKYEWPVRFDYLDTIDGGNLSTQVHPRPDYIRREFGETYTQDETYYIVNSKPDSRVYIGLKEDCSIEELRTVLNRSVSEEKELDIDKFINSEPSKPHDLFCIPNGTVHCSGSGNLVLEISATPYIFTFKIYDYLRRDLEGRLRPINIERGLQNIRPERKGEWIRENLVAKPNVIGSGKDWQIVELYNKPFTFYKILRLEFETTYELDTQGMAYTINLVEGETIEVTSSNGRNSTLAYLETMVIPAAAEKVTFKNMGAKPCKLILVHIKPETGVTAPLNDPN